MLDREGYMEIRILSRQGKGIKEICRLTGHSRNTVRKYLRSDQAPTYGPRAARGSKLDPYKDYLRERVEAARPHRLPSTVRSGSRLALRSGSILALPRSGLAPIRVKGGNDLTLESCLGLAGIKCGLGVCLPRKRTPPKADTRGSI